MGRRPVNVALVRFVGEVRTKSSADGIPRAEEKGPGGGRAGEQRHDDQRRACKSEFTTHQTLLSREW